MEKFKVIELFESIQGESSYTGKLCFFIRLSGCNIACSYCDTEYAQSSSIGEEMTIKELVNAVNASGIPLVEITGGEPLMQKNIEQLCDALLANGNEVMIETNGTYDISSIPSAVKRVVDCKTPSSGFASKNLCSNYEFLTSNDEVKFVISDRNDYEYSKEIVTKYELLSKTENILFSSVWERLEPKQLVAWIVEDKLPVRFQLQIHKVIWDPDAKCV
jgi:7-carboxy-7-deazaguanine synthase